MQLPDELFKTAVDEAITTLLHRSHIPTACALDAKSIISNNLGYDTHKQMLENSIRVNLEMSLRGVVAKAVEEAKKIFQPPAIDVVIDMFDGDNNVVASECINLVDACKRVEHSYWESLVNEFIEDFKDGKDEYPAEIMLELNMTSLDPTVDGEYNFLLARLKDPTQVDAYEKAMRDY